jgi:hypothetical protein
MALTGEATSAARKLQAALDRYQDARPAHPKAPRAPNQKKKAADRD